MERPVRDRGQRKRRGVFLQVISLIPQLHDSMPSRLPNAHFVYDSAIRASTRGEVQARGSTIWVLARSEETTWAEGPKLRTSANPKEATPDCWIR